MVQGKEAAQGPTEVGEGVREMAVRADLAGAWAGGTPEPCPPGQIVSRRSACGSEVLHATARG